MFLGRRGLQLDLDDAAGLDRVVVLLVGSDGRSGLPRFLSRLSADVAGRRADALALLVVPRGEREITLLRLPRDVFMDVPDVGYQRVGWALDYGGPQVLIDTMRTSLDVPVHHYVEVGFAAFARVVSAHGGLPAELARDRSDERTGLRPPRFSRLKGSGALALARSRTPLDRDQLSDTERIDVQGQIVTSLADRRSLSRLILSMLVALPRFNRDLVVDAAWIQDDIEQVLTAGLQLPISVRTLECVERRTEEELVSPFVPGFRSSAQVLELTPAGLRDLTGATQLRSPVPAERPRRQ